MYRIDVKAPPHLIIQQQVFLVSGHHLSADSVQLQLEQHQTNSEQNDSF